MSGAFQAVLDFAAHVRDFVPNVTLTAIDGLPGGMLAVLFFNEGDPGSGTAPDLRFVNLRPPAVARLDFIEKPTSTGLSGVLRDSDGAPLVGRSVWIDSGQSVAGASTMEEAAGAASHPLTRPRGAGCRGGR